MAVGDLGSYHLCSIYYAADEWRWPLGMNPNYGIGFDASITQCSPSFLFSLADKSLTRMGLLEPHQQHHGYIILINLVLQFIVAFLIFQHLLGKDKTVTALLIALLFTQMPEFLVRNTGHVDLGAHYIILLGIYAILTRREWLHLWFFLIAMLAAFTHVYLFGMVFGLYCLAVALQVARQKVVMESSRWRRFLLLSVVKILAAIITAIAVFYFFSGMSTGTSVRDGGYGIYRSDLLTFVDGNGSIFLGDLPSDPGEYEGAFYLGVGFVAILFVLPIVFAFSRFRSAVSVTCELNWKIVAIFCLLCTLYAASNRISIGSAEIVIPLNAWEQLGSIFRASGRFIWLPGYILCIAGTFFLARLIPQRPLVALLVVVNILQLSETAFRFTPPEGRGWSERYMEPMNAMSRAGLTGIRTMQPGFAPPDGSFFELAYPAAIAGLTIDQFYLARSSMARAAELRVERIKTLIQSDYEPGFAYIVQLNDAELLQNAWLDKDVFTYAMGDYFVFTRSEVSELDAIDLSAVWPYKPAEDLSGNILNGLLDGGWGPVEPWGGTWSIREEAGITVPDRLMDEGEVVLRLVPLGAHASPAGMQSLWVTCPDGSTARIEGENFFLCSLSRENGRTITVNVDALYTPKQLGMNEDPRWLGVSLDNVLLRRK